MLVSSADNYYNKSRKMYFKARMPIIYYTKECDFMNINLKTDYSMLFSSLSSNSSSNSTNSLSNSFTFLSDYASIKNGSYGKLLKAYYAKESDDSTSSSSSASKYSSKLGASTSEDTSETLAKVQSSTDSLKESADALLETGSKSVFKSEDEDAVYDAVAAFVNDYNSVLKATDDVNSTSILQQTLSMVNTTKSNENLLNKVGITINDDNSLSLDKDTFKAANESTVKTLFNNTGSYAYSVSTSASFINYKADAEATKANTYNFSGNYSSNYTSGSIFDYYL